MRIDAHQHFWQYDAQKHGWITDEMAVLRRDYLPQDLFPELLANGMDGCVVVQVEHSEEETLALLELAGKHAEIKGVVGWVELASPRLPERLQHFSQFDKLCGFRHIVQAEPDDRFLVRDDFCRGISCLAEHGFTYDILVYPKQLPAAVELVARFPQQPFVIDHLAKPYMKTRDFAGWAADMRKIAAHPNVYCKLSGLITEADWRNWRQDDFTVCLDVVLDAFGPERLMFGSDWPVCLLAGSYRQAKSLIDAYTGGLAEGERAAIFGGNAIEFYGLEVSRCHPELAREAGE